MYSSVYVHVPVCLFIYIHTCYTYLQRPEKDIRTLELAFQLVVSSHVGSGIKPRLSERAVSSLNCQDISSGSIYISNTNSLVLSPVSCFLG